MQNYKKNGKLQNSFPKNYYACIKVFLPSTKNTQLPLIFLPYSIALSFVKGLPLISFVIKLL
jgi:hypothetical protein